MQQKGVLSALHVVLVHGVGAPEPGSLLPSVEKGYNAWSQLRHPNIFRTFVVGESPRRHGTSPERPADQRRVYFWDCNWFRHQPGAGELEGHSPVFL